MDHSVAYTGYDGERFAYRAIRREVYRSTPQGELFIDVHLPYDWTPQDHRPAILFFFGGGFVGGTREQFARQSVYLTARGMVTARADYRVRDGRGTTVWECVEDARSAMRWLRGHAAVLGIDPQRIAASGGSAGGYLSAAVTLLPGPNAAEDDLVVSPAGNALVLFNPALGIFGRQPQRDWGLSAEQSEALETLPFVGPALPPTLIFFGTEDRLYALAKPFIARGREAGARVEVFEAPGAGHGFFNDPPWFMPTLSRAEAFLASLGWIDAPSAGPLPPG